MELTKEQMEFVKGLTPEQKEAMKSALNENEGKPKEKVEPKPEPKKEPEVKTKLEEKTPQPKPKEKVEVDSVKTTDVEKMIAGFKAEFEGKIKELADENKKLAEQNEDFKKRMPYGFEGNPNPEIKEDPKVKRNYESAMKNKW